LRKSRIFRIRVGSSQVLSLVEAKGKRATKMDDKGALMSYSYPPELTWWITKPVQSCPLPRVPHSPLIKAAI
jgi:hypothetical protein